MAFTVLKDFERVIDDLDIRVYDNYTNSSSRYSSIAIPFMWDLLKCHHGENVLDYDCKQIYKDKILNRN